MLASRFFSVIVHIQHQMGFDLQQQLGQQQILTPQMRQGLELLQSSSLELSQLVQQALSTNPVLEQTNDDSSLEQEKIVDAEKDAEILSDLADDYREEMIQNHGSTTLVDDSARDFFYNSIVAPKTLNQHLLNQLNLAGKPPAIYGAAEIIIGSLNERGFLTESLDDIARRESLSPEILRNACSVIQSFTPAGVGAETINESLLIQLHHKKIFNSIVNTIVSDHLNDLAYKRFPDIAKALGVTIATVIKAAETIATLTPNPGADFDPTHNPQIQPDIIVSFDRNGKLQAHLTNSYLPHLSINNDYKDLLSSTPDTKVRKYLKDNIRDGRSLIRSIGQRQDTLLKITEQLLVKQKEFFLKGAKALKPMTMNEVAALIEVHPTTVSRAAASKYILTPQGLFELRYFFTSGIENKDGKTLSNTSIRDTIKEIIDGENQKKPYSDSKLEKLLKEKDIKVARRTIAKYRDQLGILSSNLRKQF